jgi:hypothetical protein
VHTDYAVNEARIKTLTKLQVSEAAADLLHGDDHCQPGQQQQQQQ